MKTIHAIYEHGVFRPLEPIELPEKSEVEFEPRLRDVKQTEERHLDAVYAILSRRFRSGQHDLAARHNEHQP